jgi:putative oxidoreductase
MNDAGTFQSIWAPRVLSLLRIMAGAMYLFHGCQKLFGFPPSDHGTFPIFSLPGIAGILELFGGILILIGLFTRPVAFILSGQMAVAYFMAHAPGGFLPIVNKGELAVLYCFVFLYLAAAGGGSWSVDYCLRRRKPEPIP